MSAQILADKIAVMKILCSLKFLLVTDSIDRENSLDAVHEIFVSVLILLIQQEVLLDALEVNYFHRSASKNVNAQKMYDDHKL